MRMLGRFDSVLRSVRRENEFSELGQGKLLAEALDNRLADLNIEYAAAAKPPPRIRALQPPSGGAWAKWDRHRLAKSGGTLEQYKTSLPDRRPRLSFHHARRVRDSARRRRCSAECARSTHADSAMSGDLCSVIRKISGCCSWVLRKHCTLFVPCPRLAWACRARNSFRDYRCQRQTRPSELPRLQDP